MTDAEFDDLFREFAEARDARREAEVAVREAEAAEYHARAHFAEKKAKLDAAVEERIGRFSKLPA